ncbi:MAG: 4'-phosphopantetheinyl transferase superfamily protein [Phormidesmis sp.]
MNDEIQLWQIPLDVPDTNVERYWTHLSSDEKTRADRFRFAKDRRRFVVARGVLRGLLGKQFERSPREIQFCYGAYGKPALTRSENGLAASGVDCDFHFNLSHSGELALCVLGGDRTVGVDIEYLKGIKRLDGMMERCLTPHELSEIQQQPASEQLQAFLQRWTCKEAYLKAIGLGLTQSMQSVEVQLNPSELTVVPQTCPAGWRLQILDVPENYVGASVVAGKAIMTTHHWQHA